MTTVNGKSVVVVGSGVVSVAAVVAVVNAQKFLLATGNPNPLAEVCEGRRFFIAEEATADPEPMRNGPVWIQQGRKKKGGRRRY